MTEFGLFTLFLFLHVGAAIIAFGPTFIFPLIGGMSRKEPAHGNFAIRVINVLLDRVVIPFALSMPVTGIFLVYFGHINLADRSGWWLDIAIVLYIIALSIAVFVQRPTVQRMVRLTSRPPAPGTPGSGAMPSGAMPSGAMPSGPPPEVRETAAAIQRNGAITGILIVVIVLLMVSRPQF